jgi:hypothetical protein
MSNFKCAPGIACMLTGFRNEWSKADNGRIVVIVKKLRDGKEPIWLCTVRPNEALLHTVNRDKDGMERQTESKGAGIPQRFLMPICPAVELHLNGMRK